MSTLGEPEDKLNIGAIARLRTINGGWHSFGRMSIYSLTRILWQLDIASYSTSIDVFNNDSLDAYVGMYFKGKD